MILHIQTGQSFVLFVLHYRHETPYILLIPKANILLRLIVKKGYWQVPLEEKSKDLTISLSSLGKFRYTRAPMGLVTTGDSYNQRCDMALQGLNDTTKIVDDVLVA